MRKRKEKMWVWVKIKSALRFSKVH
jgi:hypothetical protein